MRLIILHCFILVTLLSCGKNMESKQLENANLSYNDSIVDFNKSSEVKISFAGYPSCSGMLIDTTVVLASAHCFSYWQVMPSEFFLKVEINYRSYSVKTVYQDLNFRSFEASNPSSYNPHDFVLLELTQAVDRTMALPLKLLTSAEVSQDSLNDVDLGKMKANGQLVYLNDQDANHYYLGNGQRSSGCHGDNGGKILFKVRTGEFKVGSLVPSDDKCSYFMNSADLPLINTTKELLSREYTSVRKKYYQSLFFPVAQIGRYRVDASPLKQGEGYFYLIVTAHKEFRFKVLLQGTNQPASISARSPLNTSVRVILDQTIADKTDRAFISDWIGTDYLGNPITSFTASFSFSGQDGRSFQLFDKGGQEKRLLNIFWKL